MPPLSELIVPFAVISLVMVTGWGVALRLGNGGWSDVFWSYGTGLAGVVAVLGSSAPQTGRAWLVAALAAIWGMRLGTHLLVRTAGSHEDGRYADLRREWGGSHVSRLFIFLQVQALASVPLIASIWLAAHAAGPFPGLGDVIGVLVFVAGLTGGSIADRQLAACKRELAGTREVCQSGLWGWSRHPNYFFEWVLWLSWPIIATSAAMVLWPGALALIAPALMYLLLVHVSGIPPLEAHMERSRPEAFARYKARVPAFFPSPPAARNGFSRSSGRPIGGRS